MNKSNLMTLFTFLTFSLTFNPQAFAGAPKFDEQAQAILSRYDMKFGENKTITLIGQTENAEDCSITVANNSKLDLNGPFPATSIANQRLQITVQADGNAAQFSFGRKSQVTNYSNQIRTGSSVLNISADNKTGMGAEVMPQSLEVIKSAGSQGTLTTTVHGFGGNELTCIAE
ncbi:MAG: hypothetical protein AABY53_03650 [Bdellovibrionota bacterium]